MGIEDRIKRLEARAGQAQQEAGARHRRIFDRLYFESENGRRELDGRELLPTPPELEETREDIVHTLSVTIPHYRQHGGWRYGDGKEILDRWQDDLLEKLTELDSTKETAND